MKIDFYVLDIPQPQRAWLYACKLLAQGYTEKRKIYVHVNSETEAEKLDTLLWTYQEDNFIPHNIFRAAEKFPPPIQLGFGEMQPDHEDTLLQLSSTVPTFYQKFNRVIEIVFADPQAQQLARERFKFYRSQNCDITTYKIKANEL